MVRVSEQLRFAWVGFVSPDQASRSWRFCLCEYECFRRPEPSTWAMMILGFAGVGFMAYRQ
jgi:hypothetical protein